MISSHKYNKKPYICPQDNNFAYKHKTMKYFIRAIKYFFYFAFLCTAIVTALVLIGAVEGNIEAIFEDGYNSIWKIATFFLIVASVYPKLGFISRIVPVETSWSIARETVVNYMSEQRYIIESESPQQVTFRFRTFGGRLLKMYEDRITITFTPEGWVVEGLRKDAFRIATALENRLSTQKEA